MQFMKGDLVKVRSDMEISKQYDGVWWTQTLKLRHEGHLRIVRSRTNHFYRMNDTRKYQYNSLFSDAMLVLPSEEEAIQALVSKHITEQAYKRYLKYKAVEANV
jgi:hypothetical protein